MTLTLFDLILLTFPDTIFMSGDWYIIIGNSLLMFIFLLFYLIVALKIMSLFQNTSVNISSFKGI